MALLRRIEASRAEHNRQWDVERSASVLGDRSSPRPSSRANFYPPSQRMRPATSMSSLRDHHLPRIAPVDRIRHNYDESPLLQRALSRLSHAGPSSEPRPMRSHTSLGGRSSASLDLNSASSEHGRLLYEAARASELKIPKELLNAFSDIGGVINSAARSAEINNASSRHLVQYVNQVLIDMDQQMDPDRTVKEFKIVFGMIRDLARTSDENVRDLTRLLLDVPKLIRDGSRLPPSSSASGSMRSYDRFSDHDSRGSRRLPSSPYESPIRRGEDQLRPSTSLEGMYPSDRRRTRDSLPPNFAVGEQRSFVSRLRDSGRSRDNLDVMEDSPPNQTHDKVPETPLSPLRHVLKKKASSISTHTVRAGNNFLPSASSAPLTAISAITAGEGSPTTSHFDARSIRSTRSKKSNLYVDGDENEIIQGSSPRSRFSYHTAEESGGVPSSRSEEDDEVLSGLVEAQKRREERKEDETKDKNVLSRASSRVGGLGRDRPEGGRKFSISDKFRKTLGRG